jgi:hypothetical protein
MISLLLSLVFADTIVYAPMDSQLETTIVHYFIDKDFHSRKKDMLVIDWADCQNIGHRQCAMVRGYWYLDIKEFEGEDSYQINIFLYDDKSRIVSQTIIHKRYVIEKIPQKTTIKGTKVDGGTIAPTKTVIEKPPILVRKKPEITARDIEQAVIKLLINIKEYEE